MISEYLRKQISENNVLTFKIYGNKTWNEYQIIKVDPVLKGNHSSH